MSIQKSDRRIWGLILAAAGTGSRTGTDLPKQFIRLKNQPLYFHSLNSFLNLMDEVVVVVPENQVKLVNQEIRSKIPGEGVKKVSVVPGGQSRHESVRLGLAQLSSNIRNVLVHDAARPMVTSELIERVMNGVVKQGACIPALKVIDTVKRIESGYIVETLDRESLVLAQTPQGFNTDLLNEAYRIASIKGYQGTDEASLLERIGVTVLVVEGDPKNIKVTWKEDLERLEQMMVEEGGI